MKVYKANHSKRKGRADNRAVSCCDKNRPLQEKAINSEKYINIYFSLFTGFKQRLICSIHFSMNSGKAVLIKSSIITPEIVTEETPAVLIFMTVDTEILPVGAIRGIISAVAILMVDRQKMPVFVFKLSSAFGADKPVPFKRLLPVTAGRIAHLLQFSHDIFDGFFAVLLLRHSPYIS